MSKEKEADKALNDAEQKEDKKEVSISENEKFIWLMQVACKDQEVEDNLMMILSLEKEQRKIMLDNLSDFMTQQGEDSDLIQAINYLKTDVVAEQARKFIDQHSYNRKRERKKAEKIAQKEEKKRSKEKKKKEA